MKNIFTVSFFIFIIVSFSYTKADQLAYISKEQADETVALLKKEKNLTLYCGCCNNDSPKQVKIVNIYARYTGFGEFYEVIIDYKVKGSSKIQQTALDLAYVWIKEKNKFITVAELMKYNYRACKDLNEFIKA